MSTTQSISTGPGTERLIRTGLLMVLVDAFAVMFLLDGYGGYARKNAAEFAAMLGIASASVIPSEAWTAERGQSEAAGIRPGETSDAVIQRLGPPTVAKDKDLYYLGPGGWLKISTETGRVRQASWQPAARSESDQKWQRWIGFALLGVGILATTRFIESATRRAVLTADGLKVSGYPMVPWERIKDARIVDDRDGGIAIDYVEESGSAKAIRLDEYRYKNASAIMEAIAARKRGMPHGPKGQKVE